MSSIALSHKDTNIVYQKEYETSIDRCYPIKNAKMVDVLIRP